MVKWMDEALKRERKREKETCQNIMTTAKLDRLRSAGMLLLVNFAFHTFLANDFPAFTKHGDLGSRLALSFLLSLFQIVIRGLGVVEVMAALSPGLTPASTGSGWCVNAMREGLVWEVRALKSNFPGFLSEPGEDSPGEKIK